jgi:pimeloyl-ACP methyl ester carboxylesterase
MASTAQRSTWDADATLVLINPIGNNAKSWDFIGIPDGHPFEFPGHGRQPRHENWTQEWFSDQLADSFDGPLDLIGMSMGGSIVANMLIRHPERVRSAMIMCSGSITAANYTPERAQKRIETYRARGHLADNGMAGVLDDTLTRWFTPWALRRDAPGVRFARETLLSMDPAAWYDVWNCQAISQSLPTEAFRSVTQPVTIIGGLHDYAAGLKGLEELHELIPNSRYEIMPISHMAHLEHPEYLRAAIDRHRAWAPIGQRVEAPIGSGVWLGVTDVHEPLKEGV